MRFPLPFFRCPLFLLFLVYFFPPAHPKPKDRGVSNVTRPRLLVPSAISLSFFPLLLLLFFFREPVDIPCFNFFFFFTFVGNVFPDEPTFVFLAWCTTSLPSFFFFYGTPFFSPSRLRVLALLGYVPELDWSHLLFLQKASCPPPLCYTFCASSFSSFSLTFQSPLGHSLLSFFASPLDQPVPVSSCRLWHYLSMGFFFFSCTSASGLPLSPMDAPPRVAPCTRPPPPPPPAPDRAHRATPPPPLLPPTKPRWSARSLLFKGIAGLSPFVIRSGAPCSFLLTPNTPLSSSPHCFLAPNRAV